jgi:hypothetical protein
MSTTNMKKRLSDFLFLMKIFKYRVKETAGAWMVKFKPDVGRGGVYVHGG